MAVKTRQGAHSTGLQMHYDGCPTSPWIMTWHKHEVVIAFLLVVATVGKRLLAIYPSPHDLDATREFRLRHPKGARPL